MVSMADFTFAFEMATTSTPRTASPSYTALTSFVMAGEGMTMSRGRGSEQESTAQPGRASVTLRNTDGRFTWGNGSSPYAPIQLRRPCRFRVTYSATAYDRWQGFVDEWGNDRVETTGVARLSLSDRLARLGGITLPDPIVAEMLSDAPASFWRLNEPADGPYADTMSADSYMTPRSVNNGGVITAGGVAPGTEGSTQVGFVSADASSSVYLGQDNASTISGTTRTLSLFVNTSGDGALSVIAQHLPLEVYLNADGTIYATLDGTGTITSSANVGDGRDHHIAVVASASAGTDSLELFVDGVSQGTSTPTTSGWGASVVLLGPAGNGRISNVGLYGSGLSASRIAAHAGALTGWSGETTTDRYSRLCRAAGFPSAFYTTAGTTSVTMGPQATTGQSLLDAIRDIATVEGGVAHVTDAGVMTLATAATRYNTSVGATLDSTRAGQVLAGALDFRTDDADLINESTAARPDGPPQRVVDATSVTAYDTQSESVTLPTNLDSVCLNWAQWRVASYKDPRPRCESVTVDVIGYANSGGNVANLLNADIGTKLRLSNLPSDVYSSTTLDLFVEGVRDEVTKDTYRITFTTSPVALEDTVWILGTDTLGVGTTLGY